MAGWPYILCLVIGSVQQASSLKTPPVLSRGPRLLISCLRSLLDLPINAQNSGMSLGASWRRVMLGRHVTDSTERAKKNIRERARDCLCFRKIEVNFEIKSNKVLIKGSFWNPITFFKTHHMAGHDSVVVIFFFCKVFLTVLIRFQVTSD